MLNSLTSFRFIAALMVFLFHLEILSQFQLGAAGVSFFFILSGFILTYTYHSKFKNIKIKEILKFYKARIAKIYPVHLLTFLISLPLVLYYFDPDGFYWVKLTIMSIINLSLVQSYVPSQGTYFNFNGVSWTLSVEVFFYALFPFVMLLFKKVNFSRHATLCIIIVTCIWACIFVINLNLDENNMFFIWLFHIFPLARFFEFIVGILIGEIFIVNRVKYLVKNSMIFKFLEVFLLIVFVVLCIISLSLDNGAIRGGYFIPFWSLLIYVYAFQKGVISKLLSKKVFVYLGEISFSFYMVHQLVIRYFSYLNMDKTVNFIICLGLTLFLSVLIYEKYEEPLRKRIRFGKGIRKLEKDLSISKYEKVSS